MKLLKTKKILGIMLISIIGAVNVGCSENVSAVDTEKLNVPNHKVEENTDDIEEAKNVMVKTEEFIDESEAEKLVKDIMGNDNWQFVEAVSILENREGYLIQHVGTDADFRFIVDKKTKEIFCEKSTLPGEYELVKNIEEVDNYLTDSNNIEIQALDDADTKNKEDSKDMIKTNISSEEAKSIIKNEYFGSGIQEPTKTIHDGKDVWEVKYNTEMGGEVYTRTLYVDCENGEVYSAY